MYRDSNNFLALYLNLIIYFSQEGVPSWKIVILA
uniref:Uncharacterized protein n=1 Tax=Podoviridae sp. ctZkC8 TaxID=2825259 RepID=A0A8S5UBX9_9CAUD|nr:MAG TPA: hypothetical protein [Podoviridae sp. ctZkC8]